MAGTLTLRVITPDKIILDETVNSLRIPGVDGSIGILPRHAAMVAALDAGELRYEQNGKQHFLFVGKGFAEVRGSTVRVVTDVGEEASDIDVERAKQAAERAKERLRGVQMRGPDPYDLLRAEAAMRRAIQRLRVARHD